MEKWLTNAPVFTVYHHLSLGNKVSPRPPTTTNNVPFQLYPEALGGYCPQFLPPYDYTCIVQFCGPVETCSSSVDTCLLCLLPITQKSGDWSQFFVEYNPFAKDLAMNSHDTTAWLEGM